MMGFTLAMGATHTEHDKLIGIVNKVCTPNGIGDVRHHQIIDRSMDLYKVCPIYHTFDWISEEKKDGFSYLNDNAEMISRSVSTAKGREGMAVIKSGHVPHITEVFKRIQQMADIDIHGELYKPGGTSDDVTAIMGCAEDKAIFRQTEENNKLRFFIHDIRRFNGKSVVNEPWHIRRAILEMVYRKYVMPCDPHGYIVLSGIIDSPYSAFHAIVAGGGEGLMMKSTYGLYLPDKKPANNWVKCKKELSLDAVIMGINMGGSGKNKDLFKSLDVGLWDNDSQSLKSIGAVHSGISDELRRDIYENFAIYKNKVIELSAMDWNGKSWTLRHGRLERFRSDKTIGQCTTDGIQIKTTI
jgi:hypothetical protein